MSIGRKLLASGLPRRRSRVLYVVGADGPLRGRIEATVRSIPDELRSARALGDVQVQTMRESAGVVILADESDLDVCSVASLRAYRSQDSATPILLATQLHPRTLHQLSACARAGLDAFYIVDDPAALRTLAQVATCSHREGSLERMRRWSPLRTYEFRTLEPHRLFPVRAPFADRENGSTNSLTTASLAHTSFA